MVSVIIPNYNYAFYLSDTVKSVLEQSYQNLECIVVDDGSTDNSKEIIEKLKEKDNRVKAVFKKNGGLSSARNAGIKIAAGTYISFLDSDDLWKSDKLKNQIEIFENNSDVNFVFSNYIGFYPDGKQEPYMHVFGNTNPFDFIKLNPIAGSASSVILHSDLVKKTGFFDESLRSTEDHDYWFRCVVAGANIKFCDSYDVLIRLHDTSMSKNQARMNTYNFKVLVKQLDLLSKQNFDMDPQRYRSLLSEKLQSILWIARDNFDFSLIYKIYTIAISNKIVGFVNLNFYYDLKLGCKQLKNSFSTPTKQHS